MEDENISTKIMFAALPSPEDKRDWVAEELIKEIKLPRTLDYRSDYGLIRNQMARGTCVAFAGAAIKEWQEKKDCGFSGYMSPEFIYFNRVNKDSDGMYGRDLMKILTSQGSCPEYIFPYNPILNPKNIPKESYSIAKNYIIKGYARVNTIEGLKTALVQSGPCLLCLPVYSSIAMKFWRKRKDDSEKLGGHAVAVVGYNDKGFILRNSWGILWNLSGYITFPYEDFTIATEIWTMVDLKGSKRIDDKCTCNIV